MKNTDRNANMKGFRRSEALHPRKSCSSPVQDTLAVLLTGEGGFTSSPQGGRTVIAKGAARHPGNGAETHPRPKGAHGRSSHRFTMNLVSLEIQNDGREAARTILTSPTGLWISAQGWRSLPWVFKRAAYPTPKVLRPSAGKVTARTQPRWGYHDLSALSRGARAPPRVVSDAPGVNRVEWLGRPASGEGAKDNKRGRVCSP
jgi:hypothetical protein